MNAYLSIVLIAAVIAFMSYETKGLEQDFVSIKKQAFAQCLEEHPISKEAVESIVSHEHIPDDYKVKCWLRCVMNKLGIMKDGIIDWEYCKMFTKYGLTNDEDKAKVDKIAEICRAQVPQDGKDECQLAYSAAVCKMKNWKELALPKVMN